MVLGEFGYRMGIIQIYAIQDDRKSSMSTSALVGFFATDVLCDLVANVAVCHTPAVFGSWRSVHGVGTHAAIGRRCRSTYAQCGVCECVTSNAEHHVGALACHIAFAKVCFPVLVLVIVKLMFSLGQNGQVFDPVRSLVRL